jgi:ribosomal protein S6--L-glutamate ligase
VKLYFLLVRRVPPEPSPVLIETYEILKQKGFQIETGIAEEMLQRPDQLTVAHDLYILKSHTELSLSLAGILHKQGARLLNPYSSCMATQNKIVAAHTLRTAGVPTPDCWVTGDLSLLRPIVEERPVILKPYLGHRGHGLHIVRTAEELARMRSPEYPVLVQEYIEGSGEDLKVYVVGEEVFAVRKMFSQTSFTQPGRPTTVSSEIRKIALRCGQVFGLGLYGLDLIENANGVWVVDLNTFPGYKGVANIAPRIADYIEGYAAGRLTLTPVMTPARINGQAVESPEFLFPQNPTQA